METSRCLLEALSQEGLPVKHGGKIGKPSADQLRLFLEQFKYGDFKSSLSFIACVCMRVCVCVCMCVFIGLTLMQYHHRERCFSWDVQ